MKTARPAGPEIVSAGPGGFHFEWGGLSVYVDPSEAPRDRRPADVICLSRNDPSPAQRAAVEALSRPTTVVAGSPACVSLFRLNQLPFAAAQKRSVLGVEMEAFADGRGGLGFLIVLGESRVVFKEGTWVDAGAVAGPAAGAAAGAGIKT